MSPSNPQFEIDVPDAYRQAQPNVPRSPEAEIKAVPSGVNKVCKRVIRGVLVHDTPQNKHKS